MTPHHDIYRVDVFATATNKLNSRICAHITGGPQTHIGLIFRCRPGPDIYMEAMFRMGIVPARSVSKLQDFMASDYGNRLWVIPTNITGAPAQLCYDRCVEDVGLCGYYEWQLILMWRHERIGRFLRWSMRDTPHLVVCSEWISRRLLTFGYDLRDDQHRSHDSVNPTSAWARLCSINEARNLPCNDLELSNSNRIEQKIRPILEETHE